MSFHPMIAQAVEECTAFTDHLVDDNVRPLPEQYALAPGDHALAMISGNGVENDITVMTLVDPEEHAEEFPRYAEQLANSYVLARWRSYEDHLSTHLGWFARARLIPLIQIQYEELLGVIDQQKIGRHPAPDWLGEKYTGMLTRMAEVQPEVVPKPLVCPKCGSIQVKIHIESTTKYSAMAGEVLHEGETRYTPLSTIRADRTTTGHLHCGSCNAYAGLEEEEVINFPLQ
jgi:hypothetical protein